MIHNFLKKVIDKLSGKKQKNNKNLKLFNSLKAYSKNKLIRMLIFQMEQNVKIKNQKRRKNKK